VARWSSHETLRSPRARCCLLSSDPLRARAVDVSSLKELPFVKPAPKVPFAFSRVERRTSSDSGRARLPCARGRGEQGGQGRPQAARRGSLEGPVGVAGTIDREARQGFLVAPCWACDSATGSSRLGGQDALRFDLQGQAVLAGQPGSPRVPVISSSRRGDMEWFGRSQAGSIRRAAAPLCGGHDK